MKPNKEFEVNLHVTSIEKGKPSRPDYEDEAMTNLTDEGLKKLANEVGVLIECYDGFDGGRANHEETRKVILSYLQQVRDAAKKETVERCAKICEDCDCGYSHDMCGPECCYSCCSQNKVTAIRQMGGGK